VSKDELAEALWLEIGKIGTGGEPPIPIRLARVAREHIAVEIEARRDGAVGNWSRFWRFGMTDAADIARGENL
jgi:hypothetical protein